MSKTLTTLLAGVRLFSSVNSHVPVKASFKTKTFSTVLAGEGTLSSVYWSPGQEADRLAKPTVC